MLGWKSVLCFSPVPFVSDTVASSVFGETLLEDILTVQSLLNMASSLTGSVLSVHVTGEYQRLFCVNVIAKSASLLQ